MLTGVPRSGTTLACRLLQHSENAVALFEPMAVAALPLDRSKAIDEIAGFFSAARSQLLRTGTAPSKQVDGTVPDNLFASTAATDGSRMQLATHGLLRLDRQLPPDFTLAIKHNAAFTALLPELGGRFPVIAIVRNPLSVLASWSSVDLPIREGRLPAGERLDPALEHRLSATTDRLARQLVILEWFFARFSAFLPEASVLRYEDIVASDGAALHSLAGTRMSVREGLADRNASTLYDRNMVAKHLEALVQPGSWHRWYPPAEIGALAARMS